MEKKYSVTTSHPRGALIRDIKALDERMDVAGYMLGTEFTVTVKGQDAAEIEALVQKIKDVPAVKTVTEIV